MANEKRLIDANALIKFLEDTTTERDWIVSQFSADWIDCWIESATTVDAVEVVRCKDCKHYNQTMNECESLHFWFSEDGGLNVKEDDFCSCGERRE